MKVDIASSEVRQPAAEDRAELYRLLSEAFPMDRLFYGLLADAGGSYYRWTPYCLFADGQLVGNAALFPVRFWCDGRPTELLGLATVATRADCRRQGVARRLIQHCLGLIDQHRLPGALFTRVPWLYEKFGYRDVPQTLMAVPTEQLAGRRLRPEVQIIERLGQGQLAALKQLYDCLPNYDGKVIRDEQYWAFYRTWVAGRPGWRFLFCYEADRVVGAARVEPEDDRLMLSELYSEPSRREVIESLLVAAAALARRLEHRWVTIGLIPGHFVWPVLAAWSVELEPEPPGANRERFMVRPAAGKQLGTLARLQWPFADKF